ncbi:MULTISPECIES: sensor histidine kinase [unclassified Fusibacter]|uniref:sensor histidine kinase n=1 Tax=unclassified Fusibacter TaxID=2624464 RepID=UPI001012FDAE|nr:MULTISPECIES: HAMP domain-containing sensor histidine kinase [unclassified Fusibacter]MCK8060409.1 HAMP domain-containing histidine kinase [Fusibacter sp. A2]NPE20302.1 HAMP domain-containing histidine kinase [Fusibacter sp. A1]RXV63508.1 sensor histidine kinase [Fusibacter sp. A1]
MFNFKRFSLFTQVIIALSLSSILLVIMAVAIIANQGVNQVRQSMVNEYITESKRLSQLFTSEGIFDRVKYQSEQYDYVNVFYVVATYTKTGKVKQTEYLKLNYPFDELSETELEELNKSADSYLFSKVETAEKSKFPTYRLVLERPTEIIVVEAILSRFGNVQNRLNQNILILLFITLFSSIFIAQRTSERIVNPLKDMTDQINDMAYGSLEKGLDAQLTSGSNELGVLARAFERLRERTNQSFDEINQLNESLEQKIDERTRELLDTNTELEISIENLRSTQEMLVNTQKQVAISDLVRGMAHHLNTPLGNVKVSMSYLLSLIEKSECMEKANILATVDTIGRNMDRAINIVDRLKNVSIYEHVEKDSLIDLCEFTRDLIDFLSISPENKRLTFELECLSEVKLRSKPVILLQIITSIIENAKIHGFDDLENAIIKLVVELDTDMIYIKIMNNGKRVDGSIIDTIFDPFFTTERSLQHTGLGLHIARSQTIALGGNLYHESGELGTCFTIALPYNEEDRV